MKPTREIFLVALLVGALAGASFLAAIEPRLGLRDRFTEELMYYPKGPLVQKAALGHTALAADFAWIRAVQYYGEHKRSDRKFDMMGHLVQIITDLDPQFVNAYIFGGLVMAQDARNVDAALALMEKGLKNNPDDWQMNFETGFMYYTQEITNGPPSSFGDPAAFPAPAMPRSASRPSFRSEPVIRGLRSSSGRSSTTVRPMTK